MATQLIVALDFDIQSQAMALVDKLDPRLCCLKVGSELFTLAGASLIKQLTDRHFKVFLDLKFHDIPNTVAKACMACAELGVWMINVHASGGLTMMDAAVKALDSSGCDKPLLIAVTVLTSMSERDLVRIGINCSLAEQVKRLALLAKEAGLDGVVSSAHEVRAIKSLCGSSFIAVTPGIRLPTSPSDDQFRIMTPSQAAKEGSDYLVVGRPITRAANPMSIVHEILKDLSDI